VRGKGVKPGNEEGARRNDASRSFEKHAGGKQYVKGGREK
jgi:hypothetical protein